MKKRWSIKKKTIFATIFFILIIIVLYYYFVILPIIKSYSSAEIRKLTDKAVNLSVSNVINRTISYDNLIDVLYDANGNIVSFSANQYEINSISREIVKETERELNKMSDIGLFLNVGTMTGMPFLMGKGPKLKINLVPVGSVDSSFESKFDSVGINMTKHSLLLNINLHISMVLPIKTYDFYLTNQVMLAESILLGKVPEVYFTGAGIGKSLNLVP